MTLNGIIAVCVILPNTVTLGVNYVKVVEKRQKCSPKNLVFKQYMYAQVSAKEFVRGRHASPVKGIISSILCDIWQIGER